MEDVLSEIMQHLKRDRCLLTVFRASGVSRAWHRAFLCVSKDIPPFTGFKEICTDLVDAIKNVLGQEYLDKSRASVNIDWSVYKSTHGWLMSRVLIHDIIRGTNEWRYYHTFSSLHFADIDLKSEDSKSLGNTLKYLQKLGGHDLREKKSMELGISIPSMLENERPAFMERLWEELRKSPRLGVMGDYVAPPGFPTCIQISMNFGLREHANDLSFYREHTGLIELHGTPGLSVK